MNKFMNNFSIFKQQYSISAAEYIFVHNSTCMYTYIINRKDDKNGRLNNKTHNRIAV